MDTAGNGCFLASHNPTWLPRRNAYGFFPRNGGSRAPPRGQTQAAVAAAMTTGLPRGSGVRDSQEVPRSPSLPLLFQQLLLLNPSIPQSHRWAAFPGCTGGMSSIASPWAAPPRGKHPTAARAAACRCLCKEHTSSHSFPGAFACQPGPRGFQK